jgi:hypothetical protein
VAANLKEARRMEETMKKYGLPPAIPSMGPWPLKDATGMGAAIAVLDHSLDKGVHKDTVQWDTLEANVNDDKHFAGSCGRFECCCRGLREEEGLDFECKIPPFLVLSIYDGSP